MTDRQEPGNSRKRGPITLLLTGDLMIGRGIDQILPHPGDPTLHEGYLKSSLGYVELAEEANGPIARPVDWRYVWGYTLEELDRLAPDVRLVNLETSVTRSDDYWPGKGINYRMHPANVAVLAAAGIDCCSLANNHTIDWGYAGLLETLQVLKQAGIRQAGAGRDQQEAELPAILPVAGRGRVVALAYGMTDSGIPAAWAATATKPGINLLSDLSERSVREIADRVRAVKRPKDLVVLSIHWGGNWGYSVPSRWRSFARRLIDEAGVAIVHGHSSHHVLGLEIYRDRPIFYGCGDLLNDYEGIHGHERYRGDLGLIYLATMEPVTGSLTGLRLLPTRIRSFRLARPRADEVRWLQAVLSRESRGQGLRVEEDGGGMLEVRWDR